MTTPINTCFGHDRIWQFLVQAKQTCHVAASYIFAGPSQVGKETLARQFMALYEHSFVFELRADYGHDMSIDVVRALRKQLYLRPAESLVRFVLIKDLACITKAAANSLLKILEEPPMNTVFISITNDLNSILPTLCSRSQIVRFCRLSDTAITHYLVDTHTLDHTHALFLAGCSDGRPGRALEALKNPDVLHQLKEHRDTISLYIEKVHEQGLLPTFDHTITKNEALTHLNSLERFGRDLYRSYLNHTTSDFSLPFPVLKNFLLRVSKGYILVSKNVSPSLALDQIYCNI